MDVVTDFLQMRLHVHTEDAVLIQRWQPDNGEKRQIIMRKHAEAVTTGKSVEANLWIQLEIVEQELR